MPDLTDADLLDILKNGAPSVRVKTKGGGSYDGLITQAASRHGVDANILRRLIQTESGGNPRAISPKGARGLAQLMPQTAAGLGVSNPHDPVQAIDAGARYLRQQMDTFGGDTRKALAAYNAGPGAVKKYGGVPPYAETQNYVNTIAGPAPAMPSPLGEDLTDADLLRILHGGNAPAPNAPSEPVAARQQARAPVGRQPQAGALPGRLHPSQLTPDEVAARLPAAYPPIAGGNSPRDAAGNILRVAGVPVPVDVNANETRTVDVGGKKITGNFGKLVTAYMQSGQPADEAVRKARVAWLDSRQPATAAAKRGELYGPPNPKDVQPGAQLGDMRPQTAAEIARGNVRRNAPLTNDLKYELAAVKPRPGETLQQAQGRVKEKARQRDRTLMAVAEFPVVMLLPNTHRVLSEHPELINDGLALEKAFAADVIALTAAGRVQSAVAAMPKLARWAAGLEAGARTKFMQAAARVLNPAKLAGGAAGGGVAQGLLDIPEKLTPTERGLRIGQGVLAGTLLDRALGAFHDIPAGKRGMEAWNHLRGAKVEVAGVGSDNVATIIERRGPRIVVEFADGKRGVFAHTQLKSPRPEPFVPKPRAVAVAPKVVAAPAPKVTPRPAKPPTVVPEAVVEPTPKFTAKAPPEVALKDELKRAQMALRKATGEANDQGVEFAQKRIQRIQSEIAGLKPAVPDAAPVVAKPKRTLDEIEAEADAVIARHAAESKAAKAAAPVTPEPAAPVVAAPKPKSAKVAEPVAPPVEAAPVAPPVPTASGKTTRRSPVKAAEAPVVAEEGTAAGTEALPVRAEPTLARHHTRDPVVEEAVRKRLSDLQEKGIPAVFGGPSDTMLYTQKGGWHLSVENGKAKWTPSGASKVAYDKNLNTIGTARDYVSSNRLADEAHASVSKERQAVASQKAEADRIEAEKTRVAAEETRKRSAEFDAEYAGAKFKRQTLKIPRVDGTGEVELSGPAINGLIVHKKATYGKSFSYMLTHIASGKYIPGEYASLDQAKRAAFQLSRTVFDWTHADPTAAAQKSGVSIKGIGDFVTGLTRDPSTPIPEQFRRTEHATPARPAGPRGAAGAETASARRLDLPDDETLHSMGRADAERKYPDVMERAEKEIEAHPRFSKLKELASDEDARRWKLRSSSDVHLIGDNPREILESAAGGDFKKLPESKAAQAKSSAQRILDDLKVPQGEMDLHPWVWIKRERDGITAPPKRTAAARAKLDAMEAKADAVIAKTPTILPGKGKGGHSGATLSPEVIAAYGAKLAVRLAKGTLTAADWGEKMLAEFPALAREHLDAIWDAAKTHWVALKDEHGLGEMPAREAPAVADEATPAPVAPAATPRVPEQPVVAAKAAGEAVAPRPPVPPKTPPSSPPTGEPRKYAGSINLEKIPEHLRTLTEELYDTRTTELDPLRRNVRTWAQTEAAATALIKAGKIHPETFINPQTGKAYNAEESRAISVLYTRAMEDLQIARGAAMKTDSPETMAALAEATAKAQAMTAGAQGAAAEAGRALNIYRRFRQAYTDTIPEQAAAQALVDTFDPAKAPPPPQTKTKTTTGKTPTAKPKITELPEFGTTNKFFTRDRADAARMRLQEKLFKLNAGVDPTALGDLTEIGGFYVEGGLRKFSDWSAHMKSEFSALDDEDMKTIWGRIKGEVTTRARKQAADAAKSQGQSPRALLENKLKRILGEEGMSEDLLEKIRTEKDFQKLQDLIRDSIRYKPSEIVAAYFRSNILSGPPTQVRNNVGNAVEAGMHGASRLVAGLYDVPLAALTGRPRAFGLADNLSGGIGYLQGFPQGMKSAAQIMKHGYTVEQAAKLDIPIDYQFKGPLKGLNYVPRLLGAADAVWRTMAFEGERTALAARKALNAGEGRAGLKAHLEDADVKDAAQKMAARIVFQEEPDAALKAVQDLRRRIPALHFVIPFVQTPWNIVKESGRFSPAGLLRLRKTGLRDPEAARVLAEATVGTAILASAGAFVQGTEITSSPPVDPAARDAFYRSGRQPYSIRAGDKWYSYASMGPITFLLSAVAAWKDDYWRKKETTPGDQFWRTAIELGKNLTEQSFLSGLQGLLDAIADPERNWEKYVARTAAGFIPYSGAVRTAAQATDPNLRRSQGVTQRIQEVIPGTSRLLEPRIDALGRDVKRYPGGIGALQPFLRGEVDPDAVSNELNRLEIFPGLTGKKLKVGNETVELTPSKRTAYQRTIGKAIYEVSKLIMTSSGFEKMPDDKRKDLLERAIDARRRMALEQFKVLIYKQAHPTPQTTAAHR